MPEKLFPQTWHGTLTFKISSKNAPLELNGELQCYEKSARIVKLSEIQTSQFLTRNFGGNKAELFLALLSS
jgi:6-phosphogluconolactonase (cycloisomerase 2 family)